MDLKNSQVFEIMTGIHLMPVKMSATLKLKLMKIDRILAPLIKDVQTLRAEFIKENYPEVTIKKIKNPSMKDESKDKKEKDQVIKVVVDEQFLDFLNPYYVVPQKFALLDEEGRPMYDCENQIIIDEEKSEPIYKIEKRYNETRRLLVALEREKAFRDYIKETDEFVNKDVNIPVLDYNDLLGLEMPNSDIMNKFLKPILKL